MNEWLEKVENIAEGICKDLGCYLYDVEITGNGSARILRIYIDKNETGADLEDCSQVTKKLDVFLDENDIVPGGAYSLEVSTPGIERPLRKPWHFEKAVGKKIYIKTAKSLESIGIDDKKWKNSKTIEEVLTSASENEITFKLKDLELKIPYAFVEKAKVVFEMSKGQKK